MYVSPQASSAATQLHVANRPKGKPAARLASALPQGPAASELWRGEIIRLLKDALIRQLVSVLRYDKLSDEARTQPQLSQKLERHAREELSHALRLAQRIALLGGELDYLPHMLMGEQRPTPQGQNKLKSMIEADLSSEYRTIARYAEIISQVDTADAPTRRLLKEIVDDERAHAEELNTWLVN